MFFFNLFHAKSVDILPNGENAHCTIWTPQQYADLFSKYFSTINFFVGLKSVTTICVTFNLPPEIQHNWKSLIHGDLKMYVNDLGFFVELLDKRKENIIFLPLDFSYSDSVINYLKYFRHIDKICCFATPSVRHNFEEIFLAEKSIIPLIFTLHFRDTANIFVLFPPQYHDSTGELLTKIGFKHIFFINENMINQCKDELEKFSNSGGNFNWFMNDVTKKLRELEFRIEEQQEVRRTNTAAFAEYRNCLSGKKVVIVGSGPSGKYYKPMPDAIHIALNFAWRREDISFDFLFTGDNYTNEYSEIKIQQGFEKIRDTVFVSKHLARSQSCCIDFGEDITLTEHVKRFYCSNDSHRKQIYQDICVHPIFVSDTISFAAMHFALFTYPEEIYLVGCDTASNGYFYENSNPKNLDGNKNMPTHRMKVGYARLKMFAKQYYPDTEIISVNPVGLKGLFEDIYTEDFLKK